MSKSLHTHNEDLFNLLIDEANHPLTGWDFSHISKTDRMVDAPLTWSYASKILPRIRQAQSLLDMGTGGGEFLSSLQPLPPHTCATEGYAPNIPVACQRENFVDVRYARFFVVAEKPV